MLYKDFKMTGVKVLKELNKARHEQTGEQCKNKMKICDSFNNSVQIFKRNHKEVLELKV